MKRREIIEGMAERFWDIEGAITPWSALDREGKERMRERADNALAWLESQGLVQEGEG